MFVGNFQGILFSIFFICSAMMSTPASAQSMQDSLSFETRFTTFSQLDNFVSTCRVADTSTCGPAVHRYCSDNNFAIGFGPIEYSQTQARVMCVNPTAAILKSLPNYSQLSSRHGQCSGPANYNSLGCRIAVRSYCGSLGQGYSDGIGPISQTNAPKLYCLRGQYATAYHTKYSVLSEYLDGCNGIAAATSSLFQAAISRFCIGEGFVSGLPVSLTDSTHAIFDCVG